MSDENRAPLNIDLSGFEPALPIRSQPTPEPDVIRQVRDDSATSGGRRGLDGRTQRRYRNDGTEKVTFMRQT